VVRLILAHLDRRRVRHAVRTREHRRAVRERQRWHDLDDPLDLGVNWSAVGTITAGGGACRTASTSVAP
jgi:hypothetical protein